MASLHPSPSAVNGTISIAPPESLRSLARDVTKVLFRVPPRWRSPVLQNPFAFEAERRVVQWFESLGCTPAEVARARKFDVAGYVGIPFPSLPFEKTVRTAKYLSLWLLWDDVQVETLDDHWRIEADDVLTDYRPEGMTRFDEGWWQLMQEFAVTHSPGWLDDLCQAMKTWNAAAVEEALMTQEYTESGVYPSFARQLDLRIATIGMYATIYMIEDAYDVELPRAFHADPTVRRLKTLANAIVGLGNEILSFGKDSKERRLNLVSTLMYERGIFIDEAIDRLVRMHDEALEEYDRLADAVIDASGESEPIIAQWLQDVRYASLGFSLWESQAPRYTAHKVVDRGRIIEPKFSFFPPRLSERPIAERAPITMEKV
uniref:Terpene synthase n=1 Tax=Phaselicystis flava TaxID=525924 RepID=A0A3S5GYH8_9BACT|nr:hypothetical protein [Phaselicystis flava]